MASSMTSKVVLITGANTGVGFETARALATSEYTYNIIVSGRSMSKIQDAVRKLEKESPNSKSQFIPPEFDVETDHAIQRSCEEVESRFGRLDVHLNKAGTLRLQCLVMNVIMGLCHMLMDV